MKAKATSLTALLVSILIVSTLAGAQFIEEVSAIDYTEYSGTLEGADWALRIPDPWNGMLVIYCRGYAGPTAIPSPLVIINGQGNYMLEQGFAVAASNYGAAGLCMLEAVDSTYELTTYLIDNYDVTGKVFLVGFSMGGGVVLLLGEKYPDVYSGVLDMFGIKDLKDLHSVSARWANLTDEELGAELTALGIPVPPTGWTLNSLRSFMATASADAELATGGTPETQPEAYEDRSPTYHANIEIPVITIHGTADPLVPHYQSIMYKNAVAQEGKAYLYRLYNVTGAGHGGGDIPAEIPTRFDELVEWSDFLTGGLTDWPMFRHDLTHSGYSESPAPDTNQTLWNITVRSYVSSSPAVAEGRVFFSAWNNIFYCLDAATGALVWNYTMGSYAWDASSPAVADGRVYIGAMDHNVYCWDIVTGALIWNYTTGDGVGSSPAVADGKVYIGSFDHNVYCLDAATGAKIWNYTANDEFYASSPAVADGKVYIGCEDTNFYCLDAATGALVWNFTMGGTDCGMPAVASGKVYIGAGTAFNFYCLDAATGAKIWNYTVGGNANNIAIAYGNVYASASDSNFYCLDATTGALVWNYTTGNPNMLSPPAVADGKVYFNSNDRNVYCLDATTGALIWSYNFNTAWIGSGPAIANGVVYVTVANSMGDVYAFSELDAPIPEGLSVGVMLLLSTVAAIVSICILRKQPKWKRW